MKGGVYLLKVVVADDEDRICRLIVKLIDLTDQEFAELEFIVAE